MNQWVQSFAWLHICFILTLKKKQGDMLSPVVNVTLAMDAGVQQNPKRR